jgi:Predicted hydrolases or acyltransferases (alpha/beta hydrolase superfamily)
MPFVLSNDKIKIHYEVIGQGETLLLLQGFGWDLTAWHFQIPLTNNFRLILIDNRGTGLSDKPTHGYSLEKMKDDVISILDELKVDKINVIGFSMGGIIALKLASEYQNKIKSLFIVSSQPRIRDENIDKFLDGVIANYEDFNIHKFIISQSFSKEWVKRNLDTFENFSKIIFKNKIPIFVFKEMINELKNFDILKELDTIHVPTIIIYGNKDKIVNYEDAKTFFEKIRNSKLIHIGDAGHAVMVEKQYLFNEIIIENINAINRSEFKREIIYL